MSETTPPINPEPELPENPRSKILTRAAVSSVKTLISDTFSFREGTDYAGASTMIKNDVSFRGYAVWILIFSIFIASIGLNVNSTAVVIGAMLISPLMSPIIGVGFGIGTYDFPFVVRALKNLGIMVGVSILSSTLYFLASPMKEASTEIMARTQPTIMDVLIALFGGFAGIVANSRSLKSNVIPGVAIATALMPPLCSAGFGIANAEWAIFGGAFYLFLLNSVFICLSTVLVTRYLRFPLHKYLDPGKERRLKTYLAIFVVLVVAPSAYAFYGVIKGSVYNRKVQSFVRTEFNYDATSLIEEKVDMGDSVNTLHLYLLGDPLPKKECDRLQKRLDHYQIPNTRLVFHQGREVQEQQNASLDPARVFEMMEESETKLTQRDERIARLEGDLQRFRKDSIPLQLLEKEIRIEYNLIERVAYGKLVQADFVQNDSLPVIDSLPTFFVHWSRQVGAREQRMQQEKLAKWLAVRLSVDTVRVMKY